MALLALQAAPARAVTNSDLDSSFGGDGEVLTTFGGPSGATSVAFTPQGILVAGVASPRNAPARIALARYRMDGSLDPTFGGDGKVTTVFEAGQVTTVDVLRLPSGQFVVGATVESSALARFALARYRPNGSLDPSFGTSGRVVAGLGRGRWFLRDVIHQANGKLVAGGLRITVDPDSGKQISRFAVARFLPDGRVDRAYGVQGAIVTAFHTGSSHANDPDSGVNGLAVDVQGRTVAAGWTSPDSCHYRWALARYRADGGLDATFSGDGRVVTAFQHNDSRATAVAVGDDNRISVAGATTSRGCDGNPGPDTGSAALARYGEGGRLDQSFGGDGRVTSVFLGTERADAHYEDLALMEGGFIAATGSAHDGDNQFIVVVGEYVRSGSLNKAFSGDGKAKARGPYEVAVGSGITVDPDGRPIVAGSTFGPLHQSRFLVARFLA
ncbi:MAG: hypothetical protein ACJ77A_07760 [Actinomycetota bacterium]